MREEELQAGLVAKHGIIETLEKQNHELKAKVFELKQAKNKCEERIIDLSNTVYELERGHFLNISGECSRFDEANNTLDQYSAISIDRQD
jgi:cell division septum initiation protein DivIVA